MNDNEIIDLFLKRDETALSLTSQKYGAGLRGIARNVLGDDGDAEECENDTLLIAWNTIPPKEPRNHFFSYLACIARNCAINTYRKKKKKNLTLISLDDEIQLNENAFNNIEAEEKKRELSAILVNFLKQLNDDERIIFIKRYWYYDSVKDISKKLGFSESKIKTSLFRSREKLSKILKKEGWM